MEGLSIDQVIIKFGDVIPSWFSTHEPLLLDLQTVHDCEDYWESSDNMRTALRKVASWHKLSTDVLYGIEFSDR